MAVKDFFGRLFTREKQATTRLPQVHLFGHEKAYGAPTPQDFSRFIENYKSWVYNCAWKNAISVARNDICLYKRVRKADGDVELDKVYDHPMYDLIRKVNPFSNRFEHAVLTQLNLELTGNAYWWIPRDTFGVPFMLWNVPSHWMRVVPSTSKFVEGYVLQVPGKGELIPFDEEEIVHFKFPSPFSLFYGSGPTLAAAYGIDLNNEIKTWGINFFMNNAQPSGVLETESSLTEAEYSRLKDVWNMKYRGSKNAGKIAILEQGLKYNQTGSTIKDSGFDFISKEIRDEIMAAFGTPASIMGLVEDVNRANAEANQYTYQKETVYPRLMFLQEKINEKICPLYDENLVFEFDNPVEEDKDFLLREKQINIQTGITTIDEERIKLGLEPFNLPETSKPLIPFNLTPAGEERELLNSYGQPANDEEKAINKSKESLRTAHWKVFVSTTAPIERAFTETMKRYFQAQQSEVISKLNKHKSITKDLASSIMFNIKEQNKKLKDVSFAHIRNAYVTGLTLGMKDTNHSIDLNLFEPNILRAVEQRSLFFIEKPNETTAKLLSKELTEALQAGESIDKIAQRVDKIFQYSRDFRSKRIAQTEVTGAVNDGQLRSYDEAGVKKKEWITARDELVRHSHQIDKQVVDIGQNFITNDGYPLLYPGDRSTGAPPEEVINCRCDMLPVIE